jgi:hypothetical protein
MDATEIELQILLSEKEHANHQISSYVELQLKLVAFFFGAGSAALGFLLTKGAEALTPEEKATVILVGCVAGCIVMLQSVITYGIVLGSIHYKKAIPGPRLGILANLPGSPLLAVKSFTSSPARIPVFFAAALLNLLHMVGTASLLVWVEDQAPNWALAGCWGLVVLTVIIELLMARAMKMVAAAPEESS